MASSWNQQSANANCIGTLSFPIGQITYDFVFHFYRKYMPISFHFGDIAWQNCVDTVNKKLVAVTTSFEGSKNNFKSFIYSQKSTIPANLVKIGPVGVEIIGLTESLKYF